MRTTITCLLALSILGSPLTGFAQETSTTPEKWFELRGRYFSEGEEQENMDAVTIPHLTSPDLAAAWGKPSIEVLADGSYCLRYNNPDPDSPFEMVTILGIVGSMPSLASAPDQEFDEIVNGELASVKRPQPWKSAKLPIAQNSDGKSNFKLQYFREYAGGGADGPRDCTDTFSITRDGKTGRYIVLVDTTTNATKKRLKTLSVK